MEVLLRHRGRAVTAADVRFIRALIAAHPSDSRRGLSQRLCAAWGWRQSNGAPRDMVCRGLMLELCRAGHIELPAAVRVKAVAACLMRGKPFPSPPLATR